MLAEDIFKEFKEHSVSEFFRKNAAMLGYTGKIRSLTTVVHEGVTNAIDGAEEAGILPSIFVAIRPVDGNSEHYKIVVEDNASGIPEEYVPHVFGKMLAGTKLHRNVQGRGQQGIGVSGSVMFSQVTSGRPTRVFTSTGNGEIVRKDVMIDVKKNIGKEMNSERLKGNWRGTRVEFEVKDVTYKRSRYGPFNYLRMTAIANPHVQITLVEPDGALTVFERATDKIPKRPRPMPLHPWGVGSDDLLALAKHTKSRTVASFLVSELSRVSRRKIKQVQELSGVNLDKKPSDLTWEETEKIISAFKQIKFMAPPTAGLRPIGAEDIKSGMQQILDPEFVYAVTRSPKVYHGGIPFVVEAGVAYGGNAGRKAEEGNERLELMRFANRAPLIFDQGGCALTTAAKDIDWRRYSVNVAMAPLTLFVNVVSAYVPYTSAGKQSVAEEPEVYEEARSVIMEVARELRRYLNRKIRREERQQRAGIFERYIPIIARRAASLAGRSEPDVRPLLGKIAGEEVAERGEKEQEEAHEGS
ncbi:MAG: DNA topoisomerase VI subunit B [Candidatus Hadarchaeota archaeon]|nr:DNA topoisomerase VI subunit B [Candidatus Hadarchaeota archaeon]